MREAKSLVKQRRDELLSYIHSLVSNHNGLGLGKDSKSLPSGCLAYLQRSFAKMIFAEEGATFNLGGCFAIRQLLQSALNLHLTDEWRKQVLIIVDRLIDDPHFRTQFMHPIKIHPSLEELIRIDLKLPLNAPLTSSLVRIDLLISFFCLMGQLPSENNCFVVATTTFFFSQYPQVVLSLYLEILEKGSFKCGEYEIPVHFLLETKVVSENDFQLLLPPQASQNLLGVRQAQEMLNQKVTGPFGSNLQEFLAINFSKDADKAKKIFSSFKINSLQRMILSALLFVANNNIEIEGLSNVKMKSLDTWANLLKGSVSSFYRFSDQILNDLMKEMTRCFWFVDYEDQMGEVIEGRLVFKHQAQGIRLKEGCNYEPFRRIRRLLYYKDGEYFPVDQISFFITCIDEILENLCNANKLKFLLCRNLKNYIASSNF